MTSLVEIIKDQQRQIQHLQRQNQRQEAEINRLNEELNKSRHTNNALINELIQKQRRIQELENLINNTPTTNPGLEHCLREWRNLALSLSNAIANCQPLVP